VKEPFGSLATALWFGPFGSPVMATASQVKSSQWCSTYGRRLYTASMPVS